VGIGLSELLERTRHRSQSSALRSRAVEVETTASRRITKFDLEPAAFRQGHDAQLDKAIEVVIEQLRTIHFRIPDPPYPNYHDTMTWGRSNQHPSEALGLLCPLMLLRLLKRTKAGIPESIPVPPAS